MQELGFSNRDIVISKNIYLLSEQGYFIEGGFGDNKKVILAPTVASIHGVETKYINKVINNNISRFNESDLIDIKDSPEEPLKLGFTPREIANYKNIYLLSERGYTKLVSMMDNTK